MRYFLFLLRAIYLRPPFFYAMGGLVLCFVTGFFHPLGELLGKAGVAGFSLLCLGELFLLFSRDPGVKGERWTAEEWSNGDPNEVRIDLENLYPWRIRGVIIDEAPEKTQLRDLHFECSIPAKGSKSIRYEVTPKERGIYSFGKLNFYARTVTGMLARRYRYPAEEDVRVLPAFKQMRSFGFMAVSNRLVETGVRPIRRIGRSTEFERVRNYVPGDEPRTVNWKASARRDELMVNEYLEERSQQVYSLVDTGRAMEMPFQGMTLLDHAINASLVLSNIAIHRNDKPGLLTFSHRTHRFIPAASDPVQMRRIMEGLHDVRTEFLETDMQRLYVSVRRRIPQQCLLILYTNITSFSSFERVRSSLMALARFQTLVVVLFRNSELDAFVEEKPEDGRMVHDQTLAKQFLVEQEGIQRELESAGVPVLLTAPEKLTVNAINKYLEVKASGRA